MIGKTKIKGALLALTIALSPMAVATDIITLSKWCEQKTEKGLLVWHAREGGETLEVVIGAMQHYYEMPKEQRVPHYIYIEYERMARDVYRKKDLGYEFFADDFYISCMVNGY